MNSFRYALLTGTGAVCLFASAVSASSTAVSDLFRGPRSLVPSMHVASARSVDAVSHAMPKAVARSTSAMPKAIAGSTNALPSAPQPQHVSLSNTRVTKAVISDTMKLEILPPALIPDKSEAINPLLQPLACTPTHTVSASQHSAHSSITTPAWESAAPDTSVVALRNMVLRFLHKVTPNIENVDDAIYTAAHVLALDDYRTNPSTAIFA